ncbi:MAG: MBL fold metallo-hydrolase [Frankiaceae bacterium]|nr:MBL fold metallo-hydrolase [Frankiaceae bacterium]
MQVAEGVFRLGHPLVNWYAVVDGGRVTLIDSGLTGDASHIVDDLASVGIAPNQVEAVVLTHGHSDHFGGAEEVRTTAGAHVHVHNADAAYVRGKPPLQNLVRAPRLLRHASREFLGTMRFFISHGLLRPTAVKVVDEFDDGAILPVPGAPRVVNVPGHTAGSSALFLASRGVAFTGDALVTLDCYSGRTGPRLLARESNDDNAAALASLETLAGLKARVVLPGHGDPFNGEIRDAVAAAKAAGAA